ncbi:MAG: hypothetical protein ACTSU5_19015 [Promethearchaeota archaeon]
MDLFIAFVVVTFYVILTVYAALVLCALAGGTLRKRKFVRRVNRLVLVTFFVFVAFFPNVALWPQQFQRRLPGGRNALIEADHPSFPGLNASFHQWHRERYSREFEDWRDFRSEVRAVHAYVMSRTDYTFDLFNPLYVLEDHLPTVSEVLASDYDGDGEWEDDCDGITVVEVSFLRFLGYNAFSSELSFHWHPIVFPPGAEPRTASGYEAGVLLYTSEPKRSYYIFNETDLFVPPTRSVWDDVRDNVFDPFVLDSVFWSGLDVWLVALLVPALAYAASLVLATLLRIHAWETRGARVTKECLRGALVLSAFLYSAFLLYALDAHFLGNPLLFGGVGATMWYLDRRIHPGGKFQ